MFATYTGVPDKKCVNLCLSVCVSVRCNAPRMTTIAGFLQDYNSILVYFCVFHRALLGGVLSNWCSCALRTWRMWRFRIWEIAGFVQDCMIWARLLNTIALRATLPCRCNLVWHCIFFLCIRWRKSEDRNFEILLKSIWNSSEIDLLDNRSKKIAPAAAKSSRKEEKILI